MCGKYISGLYRKNVHHANEPGSCGDVQLRGDTEGLSMPCAINSSSARASRAYRQAMGIRTTPGENEREGIDGEEGVSREEI